MTNAKDLRFQQPAGGIPNPRSGRLLPGQKPACFNRPDYSLGHRVQNGWTKDGRPKMVFMPFQMERKCVQHLPNGAAVHFGWDCTGCRHYPDALKDTEAPLQYDEEPPEPGTEDDLTDEGGQGGDDGTASNLAPSMSP